MHLCLPQKRFISYYTVFIGIFTVNNCQMLPNKLSKCQIHFSNDYCHKSNEPCTMVAESLNQIKIFIGFPAFDWNPKTFHTAISIKLGVKPHIISNEDPLRRLKPVLNLLNIWHSTSLQAWNCCSVCYGFFYRAIIQDCCTLSFVAHYLRLVQVQRWTSGMIRVMESLSYEKTEWRAWLV